MMWIYLLSIASLASSATLQRSNSVTLANIAHDEVDYDETDLSNFKVQLDKLSEDFLDAFSSAHSIGEKNRHKRAVLPPNSTLLADSSAVLRLLSVKPWLSLCSPAVEMKFLDVGDVTYAVCVSGPSYYSPAVYLGYITRFGWQLLESWEVREPQDVALLYDQGVLYVLVADRKIGEGIKLIGYSISSQERSMSHVVHCAYPTAVVIWNMKIGGLYHMAVANSGGNTDAEDLSSEIYIYNWMGTYFDRYDSVLAFDVKDIEPFHIHSTSYLAVANHRRGKDNYVVDSEIFKYSLDERKWKSHQKLRTYGAMDWEFFSLGAGTGEEFFLAVANNALYDSNARVGVVTYKYAKDIFVPFQCLQHFGATAVSAYSQGSKFLLSVAGDEGVSLYQYDGWRFVLASVQYTQVAMSSGVTALKLQAVIPQNETLVLAVSNSESRYSGEYNVYEIGFIKENHLQSWYDQSTEWCMEKYDSLQSMNTDALQELENVFFVDQKDPIVIAGNLHFDSGLEVSKLSTPSLKELTSGKVYDNQILLKIQTLSARLQNAVSRIEAISETLARALKIGGNQNVTGRYEFRDVSFLCENKMCNFNAINTEVLNGENAGNLKDNVVFLDGDVLLGVPLSVESITASDISVHGLVDGVDLNQIVTKHGSHTITGHKEFVQPIMAESVDVGGLVDGMRFTADTVLLSRGHQTITGTLEFPGLTAQWLEVPGLINGIDLKEFYQNVVLVNESYYITGTKTFTDLVVNDLNLAPGSTINNVDLEDLWVHALWNTGMQEITAPLTFSSMSMENLVVDGMINGIYLPGNVLLIDQDSQVTSSQEFRETTTINHLTVKSSINGVLADPNTGELDILRRYGQQTITGRKSFRGIFLMKDSIVHGLVDGVDLSQFQYNSVRRDFPINTNSTWTFNNLVVQGPLQVDGLVSGFDIKDLYDRALKLNETELPKFRSLVFKDSVSVNELESNDINGIDVRRDLLLVNEPQVITGEKTFHNSVILEDDSTVVGKVNNVNLSFLNNILLRIGNQMIHSKTISGTVKVKNLVVRGLLNGVSVHEIVPLGSVDSIVGSKTLTNVTFSELAVGSLTTDGLVNGVNVDELIKDTLTYDGIQHVFGAKTVRGVLRFHSGSNLETNNLNGIDLSELYADAVTVDGVQEISGKKSFLAPVAFSNLVADSIDGVSSWEFSNNWLLQGVDQIVESSVRFGTVEASDVIVERYVNNIDITMLNQSIVKAGEPAIMEGPVTFSGTVTSKSSISLSGKVQGIKLSEEAVLRTEEAVITGRKTFSKDLQIKQLLVDGLIDGSSIESICQNTVRLDSFQQLKNLTIEGDVTMASGSVEGLLAGVDIEQLYETALSLQGESFIHGLKTFDSLTIEGDLNVMGRFGGVSIADLLQNYMSLTRPQMIMAEHVYHEMSIEGSLAASNMFTGNGLVSGVDIKRLDEKVLRTTGQQSIEAEYRFEEVLFEDDIFVVGKVNGIEIPKALMRRNRTNYIKSPKIFKQPVVVLGDLEIEDGKTVQGVDVSSWFSRSVKNDGNDYLIRGPITFSNVKATDVKVKGLVDGIVISEDSLLLNYGDQVITGKKTIYNDVNVYGGLTVAGSVNGVDVADLSERVVRKDRGSPIVGSKTFKQPLSVAYLEANLVDGVNVSSLQSLVNKDVDYESLKLKLEEMDDLITEMQHCFDEQAMLFQYYELYQAFELPLAYSWLYVPTKGSEFLLLSDFTEFERGCTNVRVFQFSSVDKEFQLTQDLISSKSKAMATFEAWQSTFVVIANSVPNSACNDPGADVTQDGYGNVSNSIYIFDKERNRFFLHQNLWTPPVVDVAAFSHDDIACVLILDVTDAAIHCTYHLGSNFFLQEKLRTVAGRKASLTHFEENIILAVSSVDVVHLTTQQSVDIYRWDRNLKRFGDPVQVIKTTHAESVLLMSRPLSSGFEIFLLVAEGIVPRVNNAPRIFVYKYEGGFFYKHQEIKDFGKLDKVLLPTKELAFFTLDPRSGRINVYMYKGLSGFVRVDSISSVGTLSLHAFTRNNPADISHYLALAGPQSAVSWWDDRERAKILKSKVKSARAPVDLY